MEGISVTPTADERVRAALLAGDVDGAVTALLRSLGPEVFGFLRGVLGSDADADEVFAATSERVWRALPAFRWHCTLRTWTYVIARNEAARLRRGTRRRGAGRVTSSALEEVVAAVRTETLSALRTEKKSKIRSLRDELSDDDRTLLILRVDRDMPWEEIAQAFLMDAEGSTPGAVQREAARLRKRFQLIKKRLATRAREEGLLPK